jgi:hypothetical protein
MNEDGPDAFTAFMTVSALAEHSASGEGHLLNAAQHFLLVRLYYERITTGSLTYDRFDTLVSEAWSAFVQSTLAAYNTWLTEVSGAPPIDFFGAIIGNSREVFSQQSESLRDELNNFGVFT